jgi:hypothetical protein
VIGDKLPTEFIEERKAFMDPDFGWKRGLGPVSP